jgi:hypothetical protein
VKEMPIDAFIYATNNQLDDLADVAAPYVVAESLKPSSTGQISSIGAPPRKWEIPQARLLAWVSIDLILI